MPQLLSRVSLTEASRGNRLLADYLAHSASLHDFFAHLPDEIATVAHSTRAGADRAALSVALVAYQATLGAGEAALANARLLADPATPVVTVGQQPGLLTGPLYTPLKALTAINVAHQLAAELGRSVVPVFWLGADDDDRAEADHCGWWDQAGHPRAIHYPERAGHPGQLIGDLPAGAFGDEVLAQALPLIDGLPHAGEVHALLVEALADSADLGGWCARLLARLFAPYGLVICDARLPMVRRLGAEVLRREIAEPLRTTTAVNAQARALQQRGYRPALTKPDDVCNFFLLAHGRNRVCFTDGCFHAGEQRFTADELLEYLAEHPERLAPNAVLRPVIQEHLFGSAAFIAGPNELGYWAELLPVFRALDVAMPPVLPRAAATIVPTACARHLREWDIAPFDLLYEYDRVRATLLDRAQPPALAQAFADSRQTVDDLAATLTRAIGDVDATIAPSVLAAHQRMLNEVERLEHKARKALERRSTDLTTRLERARDTLFPAHGLQERALNIFPLLARHGTGMVEWLRILTERQEGQHLVVEI